MLLLKFFEVAAGLLLIIGLQQIWYVFRSRAMRSLAAKWGFQYIGPFAPKSKFWNPSRLKIEPPLPRLSSCIHSSGLEIRQIWDVIEGQRNGIPIFIFDYVWGAKGGQPCTVIACQTGKNPFGAVVSSDLVFEAHGWSIVSGSRFLWFTWTMRIKKIDDYLNIFPGEPDGNSL